MEQLRAYLTTLSPAAQGEYAVRAGTTIGYLRKAMSVGQKFKAELCVALDRASGGAVPKQSLRPDIWPELIHKTRSPPRRHRPPACADGGT